MRAPVPILVFIFSLSLSVAREVVSLSISLSHTYFFFSAEKFVEMYYLQLWKKNRHVTLSLLLFIVSFFPSSCNILVFTVVFPLCIYKAVLTLK